MASSFTAQLSAWARKSEDRMRAIVQESAQRVFEQANTPIAQGGNLPVDTGFLRASFAVDFDGMPSGPSENPGRQTFVADSAGIAMKLVGFEPGDTIYAGWTANYAIYMEVRYAFQRRAAQNWPTIVRNVTAEAKSRIR